jgi:hypothetical protein
MLDHGALSEVFDTYRQALRSSVQTFSIGGRFFDFNYPYFD